MGFPKCRLKKAASRQRDLRKPFVFRRQLDGFLSRKPDALHVPEAHRDP